MLFEMAGLERAGKPWERVRLYIVRPSNGPVSLDRPEWRRPVCRPRSESSRPGSSTWPPLSLVTSFKQGQSERARERETQRERGWMGGSSKGGRSTLGPLHCSRAQQIGALLLVVLTSFITRIVDRAFPPAAPSSFFSSHLHSAQDEQRSDPFAGGGLAWPDRGYGSRLSLKIYVYEDHEIDGLRELMRGRDGTISPDSCVKGQWGTQVKIHQFLLQSKFRTRKKEEADLFFVPTYVKCVRMNGGLNDKEINQTFVKVLRQMPYFRLSGGRDHVFVFPSGAGAHLFRSWPVFLNRSIFLTPEGDRTDKRDTSAFNTWKDIIIPGNVDDAVTSFHSSLAVQPIPLSERKYLANFLGRAQGKAGRLQLIELAKQFPDKLESPELKLTGTNKLGRTDYFLHLRNAKFCLAPRGESSWTLRFYEAFFMECVPVILSDEVELPFQSIIDYRRISIKWPSTRINIELLDYLQSIPDKLIEEMLAEGRRMRCLWVYAPETESCSAMVGIMWELQRKVRLFQQSAETFWLHNGSLVNRELVLMRDWKSPLVLP